MQHQKPLLMATTSSLEGYKVIDYLGLVSAEFVIGTGLFTDLFSSFTDFFGAHSYAYQEKLDRINEEAIALIQMKARRLGANAVLGLRVDHDEISGAGKSMLMVTALGTAVRVDKPVESVPQSDAVPGALTAYEIRASIQRRAFVQQAANSELQWDDEDTWQFILANQMKELAPYALRRVDEVLRRGHPEADVYKKYGQFFMLLPPDDAKEHLYRAITASDGVWRFALRIINDRCLFDSDKMLQYLRGDSEAARQRSVHLAMTDSPLYVHDDIQALELVEREIQERLPKSPVQKTRGVFGEREVWTCKCDNRVKVSNKTCDRCGLDQFGFPANAIGPDDALVEVQRKLEVLRAELQPTQPQS